MKTLFWWETLFRYSLKKSVIQWNLVDLVFVYRSSLPLWCSNDDHNSLVKKCINFVSFECCYWILTLLLLIYFVFSIFLNKIAGWILVGFFERWIDWRMRWCNFRFWIGWLFIDRWVDKGTIEILGGYWSWKLFIFIWDFIFSTRQRDLWCLWNWDDLFEKIFILELCGMWEDWLICRLFRKCFPNILFSHNFVWWAW